MTIPAPGGAVSAKTFAIYAAGAATGVAVMANYGLRSLPENAYNWSVGPVSGLHLWFGIGAVLGAAMAAKVMDAVK